MKKYLMLLISLVSSGLAFTQTTYVPVDAGSSVHFVIKNFGIKTGGDFKGLKGVIKFDPASLATSFFDVTVDANTINTDNNMRDDHLKESEYFDVAKYKTISFKSTKVLQSTKAGRYYVYGNITIKNVTKPVEFGFGITPKDGGYIFDGQFEINRRDFGVGSSSISLADKLKISLTVFAKK